MISRRPGVRAAVALFCRCPTPVGLYQADETLGVAKHGSQAVSWGVSCLACCSSSHGQLQNSVSWLSCQVRFFWRRPDFKKGARHRPSHSQPMPDNCRTSIAIYVMQYGHDGTSIRHVGEVLQLW